MTQACDVLIIGGGPAGTTAATLLQRKGYQVVLVEKDHHPRFHIGESLLPHTMPILEELGVMEKVAAIGLKKNGVEFISDEYKHNSILYFSKALDKSIDSAFQVKRDEFDTVLFEQCQQSGVQVEQGYHVNQVKFLQENIVSVSAVNSNNTTKNWQAKYIIDASGRDTFMAKLKKLKIKNSRHTSAAIYTHMSGIPRDLGKDAGNIKIIWFKHGWMWLIPFRDGSASVGAVCWPYYLRTRKNSLEDFFWDTITQCEKIKTLFKDAKILHPVTATANFSYESKKFFGERWLAVGDASIFIDPVFSSGVHMAMHGAKHAVDAVVKSLQNPRKAKNYARAYESKMRRALKPYSWMIYHTTQPALRTLFMNPRNVMRVEEAVMSLLAGDVFNKTPIKWRLRLFKLFYKLCYLSNFKENQAAKQRRMRHLHEISGPSSDP